MADRKKTYINKIGKNPEKRHTSVLRLKTRSAAMPNQREQDIKVIDATVKALYNDGDRMPLDFKSEILHRHNIVLAERYSERIWDILLSTGLVSPVIGFGNAGKLSLTNDGYQLMNKYGSYSGFLETLQQEQQAQHQSFQFPQFIIQPNEDDKEQEVTPKTGTGNKHA